MMKSAPLWKYLIKRTFIKGNPLDIKLAESAVKRLKILKKPLRVQVDSGGCHGFQYNFELIEEESIKDNDL